MNGTTASRKAVKPASPIRVRVCWVERLSFVDELKRDWIELMLISHHSEWRMSEFANYRGPRAFVHHQKSEKL